MPAITFGNWFSPFNRRQVFAAAPTSQNAMSLAVFADRELPLFARFGDALWQTRPRQGWTREHPMLGGKVEEGEQSVPVFGQAITLSASPLDGAASLLIVRLYKKRLREYR